MSYLELISVPAIAAVVFGVMSALKYAINSSKFNRFVPLLSAVMGAVCGVVCYYALPDIIPARNVVVALVIGGASGLTATGTHQLVKGLGKDPTSPEQPEQDDAEEPNASSDADEPNDADAADEPNEPDADKTSK